MCEGEKTEPRYFRDLIRAEALRLVDVDIDDSSGVPKTVVKRAIKRKDAAERNAMSAKDDSLRYDQVWCVLDVDEHPGLKDAQQQARANGVELAISNPCFELWLLLHFREQNAYIDRGKAQSACRANIRGFVKEAPYDELRASYDKAVARARSLDARHAKDGCPGANPSTGVYRLTSLLMSEGRGRHMNSEGFGRRN